MGPTRFDVVAVGASAGGLGALSTLLGALPADFPAGVAVVQHLDPRHDSAMAGLLAKRTSLRVAQAEDGSSVAPGCVLVGAPDHHMLVGPGGKVSLTQSEAVHFVRPAVDLLFGSVADAFGDAAIAVVLTGTGSDGAEGVVAVKEHGGTVFVQEEESAKFSGMPGAAIRTGCADFVLPLEEIGPAIVALVMRDERP